MKNETVKIIASGVSLFATSLLIYYLYLGIKVNKMKLRESQELKT